jgi:hypothetical protein
MSTELVGPAVSLSAQRTYRNLRVVMLGALVALTAAVLYQTAQQQLLLDSISAYYYTPAQSIFVGALIGLGLAMVALRGTNDVEDVLLNLAGIAAPVIALVPTPRGSDFLAAKKACEAKDVIVSGAQLGPHGQLDCPTIRAIVAANRTNVQNNMFAYLVTGAVALVFGWYLVHRETKVAAAHQGPPPKKATWWSIRLASAAWLVAVVVYIWELDWLIGNAHFWAAIGLFVLIVGVVVANAFRLSEVTAVGTGSMWQRLGQDIKAALSGPGRWYGYYALFMVVVTAVVVALWWFGPLSLFWVEITVIGLFAVFWIWQTREQYLNKVVGLSAALAPGP